MCANCGGGGRIHGRRLCKRCYESHRRADTLIDFEPSELDRDTLLDEYRLLRSDGVLAPYMPSRIGISAKAFERAMYRARRAGDPRAADWRGPTRTGVAA